MAEDLTKYLAQRGIRVEYLHSDVDTLRRVELLRSLRQGEFDVLVGINLLREGLDLPEVSLVSILDADKQGFLRSTKSLIQTIGRAARNVHGEVHMYADAVSDAMREAIDETERRRRKQIAYNEAHGIDPQPLRKKISDVTDMLAREDIDTAELLGTGYRQPDQKPSAAARSAAQDAAAARAALEVISRARANAAEDRSTQHGADEDTVDLVSLVAELTDQMHAAASELRFELAARLRDEIADLKKEIRRGKALGN